MYKIGLLQSFFAIKPESNSEPSPIQPVIQRIAFDQLPEGFPKDIPLEKGAEILQNYSFYNSDVPSKKQATREFISSNNLNQNLKIYQQYLQKNDWSIYRILQTAEIDGLFARKKGREISIILRPDKTTGKVIVNISLVLYLPTNN